MTDKEQIIINGVDVSECGFILESIGIICQLKNGKTDKCNCSDYPNCDYKQLARKTQECEELKIKLIQKDEVNTFFNTPIEGWDNDPCKICESKNNYEQLKEDYAELEHGHNEVIQDFRWLKQKYENLKAEEKYLKQCCEKAGEELAKHSFDYDGKEKNLVVQAMELNEKYEKFEKALEEIETELSHGFTTMAFYRILDIINKAKGTDNE